MLCSKEVAKLIDHAILKPQMTRNDVKKELETAVKYNVKSACVRSCDVAFASSFLKGTGVETGTVVGFPHANCTTEAKVAETLKAFSDGAEEIDMVMPIGLMLSGEYAYVENDISSVLKICREHGAPLKVIFENCYLKKEDIIKLCEICSRLKVDYVKTSTGFGEYGARLEDVRLMKQSVSEGIKIKASGGIRTLDEVLNFYEAGASRIGASATKAIVEEAIKRGM